jgi:glycosyltransferase involved in cell wall biosynthesis
MQNTISDMPVDIPIHILLASLARGGAERVVCETVSSLQAERVRGNLFVLWKVGRTYDVRDTPHFRFFPATGAPREQTMKLVAQRVLDSPLNLVLTHLIPARDLEVLWKRGVRTAPVIQNTRPGWQDEPSAFAHPLVPFLAAASLAVARELREAGCAKPVVVVRHELQRWFTPSEIAGNRARIRARYGIGDHEFLVGMVGNFKAQKAYPRAVRVLDLLRRYGPARLMILGSWNHEYGYGCITYEATRKLARDLAVEQDLILPGSVEDVEAHYAAFDAFLNTSIYEGLSIAMLEAQQAGCSVVTADAGGNIESVAPGSQIVHDSSDIQSYVEALLRVRGRQSAPPSKSAYPALIPRFWRQLALYGNLRSGGRILFVTNSLNGGGATRSLVNLLTRFPSKEQLSLCVLGTIHNSECLDQLQRASVQTICFDSPANVVDCAERVLAAMHGLDAGTLCFWNVDACVKLLIAKVLSVAQSRIVDASPGPTFFKQLAATEAFQLRIAFSVRDYFDRLDFFVAKYRRGVPPAEYCLSSTKVAVIPNGVPCPPEPDRAQLPERFAEAFRIVSCCRLVPEKRVEFLIDSAAEVAKRLTQASLTVVGGPERGDARYAESLALRAERRAFHNAWFAGPQTRVSPFLNSARVFVTASMADGCSNAVIEAMAAGLPVVATSTPAVVEQVEDGVTGFISPADEIEGMAGKVTTLLTDPDMARAFGHAALQRVQQSFGIDRMVKDYIGVLAS